MPGSILDAAWGVDDRFAASVARAVLDSTAPIAGIPPTTKRISNALSQHGLLGHFDAVADRLDVERETRRQLLIQSRALKMVARGRIAPAAQIREVLLTAGIRPLFTKGIFLAEVVWGRPDARGAGDIDVVVETDDLARAVAALMAAGAHLDPATSDLRPSPLDRRMHHGLTLDFEGVSIDLHYRLDDMPDVLAQPLWMLVERGRSVDLNGEAFDTTGDLDSALLTANHGGRDGWPKWGGVLDFAALRRAGTFTDEELIEAGLAQGMGQRVPLALELARIVDPTIPPQPQAAQVLARRAFSTHLGPTSAQVDRFSFRGVGLKRFRLKLDSVGSAEAYRWGMRRVLWPGDAPGRSAEAGLRAQALSAATRIRAAAGNSVLRATRREQQGDPAVHGGVVALAIAAMGGSETLDVAEAWSQWRAIRPDLDAVTGAEMELLPAAWAQAQSAGVQDHDEPRLTGLQRRAALTSAVTWAQVKDLTAELSNLGIFTAFSGAAAAAQHYPGAGLRELRRADLLADRGQLQSSGWLAHVSRRDRALGRVVLNSGKVGLWWRLPAMVNVSTMLQEADVVSLSASEERGMPPADGVGVPVHPADAAFHVMLTALLRGAPGAPLSMTWAVDLWMLSRSPNFDADRLTTSVVRSGYAPLFAAHGRAWSGVLPDELVTLMTRPAASAWHAPVGAAQATVIGWIRGGHAQ